MPRKKLDIEKLLQWAYRDELPKTSSSPTPTAWLAQFVGELGVRVDDDQIGPMPGFPAIMGEPHPDARKIAQCVRALPDEEVRWDEHNRQALMGDMLGLAPTRSTFMIPSCRTVTLITMHASMGTRPDWTSEPPTCHRVIGRNGKPVVEFDGEAKIVQVGRLPSRRHGANARCPLTWEPRPESVAIGRAEYAAWHKGLVSLVENLRDALEDHEALPPLAPADPWHTGAQPKSTILQGKPMPHHRPMERRPLAAAPYRFRIQRERARA